VYSSAAAQSVAVCIIDVAFFSGNVRGLLIFTNLEPGVAMTFIGIIVPSFYIPAFGAGLGRGGGGRVFNVDKP
jgi:hypothetical protein